MRIFRAIFILFTLNFFFISIIPADPIETDVAKTVAKNFYWKQIIGNKTLSYNEIIPNLIYTKTLSGKDFYYVFNINANDGFVIVSSDNDVFPVLCYSFNGSYSSYIQTQPPAFIDWMNCYSEQIKYVKENNIKADNYIKNKWNEYIVKGPGPQGTMMVGPLLQTTWDQGCYYNTLCPAASSGQCGHTWAGCVACAMAQIMKYWNYPAQGQGNHCYNCPNYGQQCANFGATTYGWSNMPNSLTGNNSSVSTLIYHCAVSIETQFGTSGSSALINMAINAFVSYFKYTNSLNFIYQSSYSDTAWQNILKSELNAFRPFLYDGSGSSGEHCFVCDGYQGTNYFHFNWGWSGQFNGYFYLSNLNPNGYNFSQNQAAMIGIQPLQGNVVTLINESFEGTAFPPLNWKIIFNGTNYWSRAANISAYGNGTGSAKFDFFDAPLHTSQILSTPVLSPPTGSGYFLTFNYAYATKQSQIDSLIILISSNGGNSWSNFVILTGGQTIGSGLVTAPPTTSQFVPTSSQWGSKSYSLPAGINTIGFDAVSQIGNNLYIDNVRVGTPIGIIKYSEDVPKSYILYQNYPNPFNPNTNIEFTIPASPFPSKGGVINVTLKIYDVLGREIASLIPPLWGGQEGLRPGTYEIDWNAANFASGVYFYRLNSENYTVTKKLVLIK